MKDIGDAKYSKQYNDCEPKAVNATVVDEMNDMVADYNEKGASENLFNPYGDLESQIYAAGNKFDDRPGFSKITNRVPFVIVLLLATQIFSCFIAWYLVPRFRISEGVDIF